jgi:hypothetical protein
MEATKITDLIKKEAISSENSNIWSSLLWTKVNQNYHWLGVETSAVVNLKR